MPAHTRAGRVLEGGDGVDQSRATGAQGLFHLLHLHPLLVQRHPQQTHIQRAEKVNGPGVGWALYQNHVARAQQQLGHQGQRLLRAGRDQDVVRVRGDTLAGQDVGDLGPQGRIASPVAVT